MGILYGKEYIHQCDPRRSRLEATEIKRCTDAVRRYRDNPRHPGLKLERLGSGQRSNHWSIRASQELRVILAVANDGRSGQRFAAVNMGHHDPMYHWAKSRQYYTNLNDPGSVCEAPVMDGGAGSGSDSPDAPPVRFEDWMLFPSEDQVRLARAYLPAPARIRGSAGTGKTVVALHRAKVLGERYGDEQVLVTTFSRSLCNHLKTLFLRMPAPPANVEFLNIDRLPSYRPLGLRPEWLDYEKVEEAFEIAYSRSVPAELQARLGRAYLREEISRVIKARDAQREEYLDAGGFERIGRIRSFKRRDREVCWNLREAWDQEMQKRGTLSFEDRLVMARDRARELPKPLVRCAIVDEGQDMTLVGVQLVRALVAGPPEEPLPHDSFLMLDDSAQRIYAGGFRPKWAGLDYRGNARALTRNHRISEAVYEAASCIRGEVEVARSANDDGGAGAVEFERAGGSKPIFMRATEGEAPVVWRGIQRLLDGRGYRPSEIGVLMRRNGDVDALQRYLLQKDIPVVNLKEQRGQEPLGPGVRVGTLDRAKGLEFRAVFIPRLGESRFPVEAEEIVGIRQGVPEPGEGAAPTLSDEDRERRQLHLDRLYVAMTRAREYLVLVADEEPCKEIRRAGRYLRFRRGPSLQALSDQQG